jgi:hypothetical protein
MLDIWDSDWLPRCNATYSHRFITPLDTFTRRAIFVNCRTHRPGLHTQSPADFFINGPLAKQKDAQVIYLPGRLFSHQVYWLLENFFR